MSAKEAPGASEENASARPATVSEKEADAVGKSAPLKSSAAKTPARSTARARKPAKASSADAKPKSSLPPAAAAPSAEKKALGTSEEESRGVAPAAVKETGVGTAALAAQEASAPRKALPAPVPAAALPPGEAITALAPAPQDAPELAPQISEPVEDDGSSAADAGAEPRKSRRGRRGGRGRGRKKAPAEALRQPDDDGDDVAGGEEDAPEAVAVPSKEKQPAKDVKKEESLAKTGRRKMFISVVPGEQVEVALVEEGAIHEYYLEMSHQAKIKGNIYKGVVHNVDTNLQAAFVSYGAGKNGFLQIDEIHPEYYLTHHEPAKGKKFPPIQKVIKAGQEVLVQVVKEPTGNKGAFLTTWLSLAGRFLVLTPGQEQIGVSRKVDNDEERSRLREMMNGIEPGEGLGVIVRTVSAGTSKTTLKNDLQYLKRVWREIRKRGTTEPAPSLIYKESGLAERAVRDYLTDDVCEVWVDNESVAESLRETVSLLFPRKKDLVRVHSDPRQTLWERFNIQRQLEQIYSREVTLPSGGRLVFDQTEALMAVDINSGKISGKGNFESMALKTNLEAAEAIARHLKLRDIGGQVVIDFIEMRDKNHIRDVEKVLRNAMKNDRARHDVGRMSSFGLLEIVRQRTGSSALAITMEPCPVCNGTGLRRNMEWQSLQVLRELGRQARMCANGKVTYEATAELGMYLLNHKRDRLREIEQQHNLIIEIRIRP